LLWIVSPFISIFFAEPALVSILRVLGFSIILSALSVTAVAVLRRNLQFRTLATIEALSFLIGFGAVGISLALRGYGVWSLVAANVVQPLCLLLPALYFIKQPISPYFGLGEYRDLLRFAFAESLNNVINFAAEYLQFVIIGKCLGTSALGLYNRSFHVMNLPVRYISLALSSVMFPVYSRIQGNVPRLRRAFLRTISVTSVTTVPIFFSMAAVPTAVIGGLYGPQWNSAAGAFQILCLTGPLIAMMRVFGAVSHARGYVMNECRRQLGYLAIMAVSLSLLFRFGIEGIALAVLLATFGRYILLAHLSLQLLELSWRRLLLAHLPGYLFGAMAYAGAALAHALGALLDVPGLGQIALAIAGSLLSLACSFIVFPSSWFGDLYPWINESVSDKIPNWARRLITVKVATF
jgi:O-antigen/teichoic acid export membrane protein